MTQKDGERMKYKIAICDDDAQQREYVQEVVTAWAKKNRHLVNLKLYAEAKPSIDEFLYICEYLNVSPRDFFDESQAEPILIQKALDGMRTLSDKDLLSLLSIIDRFNENK